MGKKAELQNLQLASKVVYCSLMIINTVDLGLTFKKAIIHHNPCTKEAKLSTISQSKLIHTTPTLEIFTYKLNPLKYLQQGKHINKTFSPSKKKKKKMVSLTNCKQEKS